jgi:very-short-patch-repair endonuclease
MRNKNRLLRRINRGKYLNEMSLKMAQNSFYRIDLKKKATKAELIFKDYLDKQKIKYIFQKGFLTPFHRIVDFYIPRGGLIIEIDGGYHNDILEKDNHKDKIWGEKGFKTIRIKNSEIFDGSFLEKVDFFNTI